jgi:hypothetical protein
MKPTAAAAALLVALLVTALTSVTGCHADPHDTHITSPVAAPR